MIEKRIPTRRDFLKATLVGLSALTPLGTVGCQLLRDLERHDVSWKSLHFYDELEGATVNISWDKFLTASDRYNIPVSNFRRLAILITPDTLSGLSSFDYFEQSQHVETNLAPDDWARIWIAGGRVLEDVKNYKTRFPTADQTWEHRFLSNLLSHAVFVGYSQIGVERGLLEPDFLDEVPLKYYNDLADGRLKPMIEAELIVGDVSL